MESPWPRVARIDGESLTDLVYRHAGLRLEPLRTLDGGQVGAALVALPGGLRAVLSLWGRDTYARFGTIGRVVGRLRGLGYPAPAYLRVIDCGDVAAVLQEYVDGEPVETVSTALVADLLALNGRQRAVFATAGGSLADLYLDRDGPGFCLHAPLESHSAGTRALLAWIRHVGRTAPAHVFTGTDAVHLDFHPGNVLLARGSTRRIAAVVDWTGAQVGDCGVDLVTLGFACDRVPGEPAVAGVIRDHIAATVEPERIVAFTAHMALRMVDWAIRHFTPEETARWIAIAGAWKDFADAVDA
jgi:hypothetical protein